MTKPLKEDLHTEFKTSFNDGVIESLSAFANTNGGQVLVGISDNGKPIKAFSIGDETPQKWINEVKNKTQPSIIPDANIIKVEDSVVGELTISEFPIKPVAFKGRYYKRVNNSNHLLSHTEISDLSLQSLQLSWDSYPAYGKTLDDLDSDLVETFIERVNAAGRFPATNRCNEQSRKTKTDKGAANHQCCLALIWQGEYRLQYSLGKIQDPHVHH